MNLFELYVVIAFVVGGASVGYYVEATFGLPHRGWGIGLGAVGGIVVLWLGGLVCSALNQLMVKYHMCDHGGKRNTSDLERNVSDSEVEDRPRASDLERNVSDSEAEDRPRASDLERNVSDSEAEDRPHA